MKTLLPLLLIYALMTTQTFALSGGPVFGSGTVAVTGFYSGVLQGAQETTGTTGPAIPGDPVTTPPGNQTTTASNSIGLFTLTVPAVALATGTFMLFADGVVFIGTIDASADPDSGQIKGLVQGSYTVASGSTTIVDPIFGNTTIGSTATGGQAVGKLTAQARSNRSGGLFSTVLARITGNANLDINFGAVDPNTLEPIVVRSLSFDVLGFKQQDLTTTS